MRVDLQMFLVTTGSLLLRSFQPDLWQAFLVGCFESADPQGTGDRCFNQWSVIPSGYVSDIVRTYYVDAGLIPSAVNNVAAATQANVVVNYPNVSA